jgi:hypothetical protein
MQSLLWPEVPGLFTSNFGVAASMPLTPPALSASRALDVHFTSPAPVYGFLGARAPSPLLQQARRLRASITASATFGHSE